MSKENEGVRITHLFSGVQSVGVKQKKKNHMGNGILNVNHFTNSQALMNKKVYLD